MEVLIFKTNIRSKKHINLLGNYIAEYPGIIKWNVDLKDVDKILRVESAAINSSKIEMMVKNAGYCCEELKD